MSLYLPEDAPAATKAKLQGSRAVQALEAAGTPFLVYDPRLAADDVVLLHFFFDSPEGGPRVSAVCTSGLCATEQRQPRAWCFPTFELAVAFFSPGFSVTFLHHLLLLTRDVRDCLADPNHPAFGIGDWISPFPMIGDARSALFVPPAPELVQSGLRPFDALPSTLEMRDWLNPGALRAAGSFGFLQAVSIHAAEFDHVVSSGNGFRFFLDHLLASDQDFESGRDAAFKILDMKRASAL
jgi:hypothetical protein